MIKSFILRTGSRLVLAIGLSTLVLLVALVSITGSHHPASADSTNTGQANQEFVNAPCKTPTNLPSCYLGPGTDHSSSDTTLVQVKISPLNAPGLCLTPASTKAGAHVKAERCSGNNTTWAQHPAEDRQAWIFKITLSGTTYCLDSNDGTIALGENGFPVAIQPCSTNDSHTQDWDIGTNGELINAHNGNCLDMTNQGSHAGTQLQTWTCWNNSNSQPATSTGHTNQEYTNYLCKNTQYYLSQKIPGCYLGNTSISPGDSTLVVISPVNAISLCITPGDAGASEGTQVTAEPCFMPSNTSELNPNLTWTQMNAGTKDYWTFQISLTAGNSCLAAGKGHSSKTGNGNPVVVELCNPNDPTQEWSIGPNGELVNLKGSNCLDTTNWGAYPGTPLQTWTCQNTNVFK